MTAALGAMRRVLRDDGLLLLTLRDYDELLCTRPSSSPPQVSHGSDGRSITFQLWQWHDDGRHYDQEYFQLVPDGAGWEVRVRRTTSWALTRDEVTEASARAGFTDAAWYAPGTSGFHQPVLTARAGPFGCSSGRPG